MSHRRQEPMNISMRRPTSRSTCGGVAMILGMAAAATACSGDVLIGSGGDSGPPTGRDAGVARTSGGGTGAGTGTATGTGTRTGTGTGDGTATATGTAIGEKLDGATGDNDAACDPPVGGPACTPGQVPCGSTLCNVPATECCADDTGAMQCVPNGGACNGSVIACEERGDCAGGKICCFSWTNTSSAATCQDPVFSDGGAGFGCPGGSGVQFYGQLCRSSAECPAGVSCGGWTCFSGYGAESCGQPLGPVGDTCTLE